MLDSLISSTPVKLKIANFLYKFTKIFFRKDKRVIKRNGLTFEVDIREGIDLHVFLFGGFQSHVYDSKHLKIPKDGIIFDVGGNVGILSLFFAQKVPQGEVHAFEPTHYALKKFKRNVDLNPSLKPLIRLNNCFLSSKNEEEAAITAYSSWRIDDKQTTNELPEISHEIHGGTAMDTSGVNSITLDSYCERNSIENISLIKIDTDGHELEVLKGAKESLKKFKPFVVFELSNYLLKEKGISFEEYLSLFEEVGYEVFNEKKTLQLTLENYNELLPENGSIDALAIPK